MLLENLFKLSKKCKNTFRAIFDLSILAFYKGHVFSPSLRLFNQNFSIYQTIKKHLCDNLIPDLIIQTPYLFYHLFIFLLLHYYITRYYPRTKTMHACLHYNTLLTNTLNGVQIMKKITPIYIEKLQLKYYNDYTSIFMLVYIMFVTFSLSVSYILLSCLHKHLFFYLLYMLFSVYVHVYVQNKSASALVQLNYIDLVLVQIVRNSGRSFFKELDSDTNFYKKVLMQP